MHSIHHAASGACGRTSFVPGPLSKPPHARHTAVKCAANKCSRRQTRTPVGYPQRARDSCNFMRITQCQHGSRVEHSAHSAIGVRFMSACVCVSAAMFVVAQCHYVSLGWDERDARWLVGCSDAALMLMEWRTRWSTCLCSAVHCVPCDAQSAHP